jgi:hypothetical protein
MRSIAVGLAAAVGLAVIGCGGLETPDLSRGEIAGTVTGAAPAGGYVYVVGEPATLAVIRADGSFALPDVPAGAAKLVVYDGADRAEVLQLEVRGAERTEVRRQTNEMPKAGRIVADARCSDAAPSNGTEFELVYPGGEATRLRGTKRGDGPVVLFPVPKGEWTLKVRHEGYLDSERAILLDAGGDELLEVAMERDAGVASVHPRR